MQSEKHHSHAVTKQHVFQCGRTAMGRALSPSRLPWVCISKAVQPTCSTTHSSSKLEAITIPNCHSYQMPSPHHSANTGQGSQCIEVGKKEGEFEDMICVSATSGVC